MNALRLTKKEMEMLEYYMSGWKRADIARILPLSLSGMDYRKHCIRNKYHSYIGKCPKL